PTPEPISKTLVESLSTKKSAARLTTETGVQCRFESFWIFTGKAASKTSSVQSVRGEASRSKDIFSAQLFRCMMMVFGYLMIKIEFYNQRTVFSIFGVN